MKFKTWAFVAASAIGMNASALDLKNYNENYSGQIERPTIFQNGYYATTSGKLYRDNKYGFDLLYELEGGSLLSTDGVMALGYTGTNSGSFYVCPILECNVESSRKYVANHKIFYNSNGYYATHNQNSFSGFGHAVVKSRKSMETDYTVSVVDENANVLSSFVVGSRTVDSIITSHYLTATTGVTRERDFKLLTSNHGEYLVKMKVWDNTYGSLKTVNLYTKDGQLLNNVYPDGVAPIAIFDPISVEGALEYPVFLALLDDKNEDAIIFDKVLWGRIKVENGKAEFTGDYNVSTSDTKISGVALSTSTPILHKDGMFTFIDFEINTLDPLSTIDRIDLGFDSRTFYPYIYKISSAGDLVVLENTAGQNGFKIFSPSFLSLTSTSLDIDPYLSPDFSVNLTAESARYYGIEANCSLQTTNAVVNTNEYIDLSETALQIPIEWDAVTGEWKGAQSLTGLESLSGSKNFAQFNLTADVTTGTWTMNCSGIASDIEGNKIELNPAEITINLDDKIHGGSSVITGRVQIPNTSDYSGVVVTITLNGRQIEVTTMADGTFTFDRLVEGDYTVHVFSDQYVAACTNLTLDGATAADSLTIQMYAGDINNDGAVDIGDFSYLSSLYGLSSEEAGYDALADLNHDGLINVQDLSILGSHFGTDHCEVVPE